MRPTLAERLIFALAALLLWARAPRMYLRYRRRQRRHGQCLHVAVPQSVDDKFAWRKVVDHDPRHVRISDKLEARAWLAEIGCTVPSPNVLWVGTDGADIPEALLREDVVIKSNHAFAHVLFSRDGLPPRPALTATIAGWLAYDHSTWNHQWAYGQIAPKIFVEENVAPTDRPLDEWKMFTFGGQVGRIVRQRRFRGQSGGQVFERDASGRLILQERAPSTMQGVIDAPLPPNLDAMIAEAGKIAQHFDHVRVDFMADGAHVWIGELTLYNNSGYLHHGGYDPDYPAARQWDLRKSWFLRHKQPGFWGLYAKALRRILDASDP